MPAVITNKFRIYNAIQFVDTFSKVDYSTYFYLGGVIPYADELNPPSPGSTPANTDVDPWLSMFGTKRIQSADVSHVSDRFNWTSGVVYAQYDDQGEDGTDILVDQFHVVTDELNVYKCLFNNGGTPSTTKPTGTDVTTITTADGYIWKYMFTVSTADALKFLTPSHIPVKVLTSDDGSRQWLVQEAAVPGSIDVILIENAGSGYETAPTVQVFGNGTGLQLTATVSGGSVTSINILNRGSGYSKLEITLVGGGPGGTTPANPALVRAIIPPRGGHGSDPIRELGGAYVIMNTRLDGSESETFTTRNEFRQLGVITNPTTYGTSTVATAPVYRQTYKYQLTGATGIFERDETIAYGSNTAIVVDFETVEGNTYLYTTVPTPQLFDVGVNLQGQTSTANGTILTIETPGLQPYSGDIIYIENRVSVARADSQVEDIKLIVEF
jgi:hypothetical protein